MRFRRNQEKCMSKKEEIWAHKKSKPPQVGRGMNNKKMHEREVRGMSGQEEV